MAVAYCGYIDGTVSAGTTTVSVNLSPGVAAVGQLAVVTIRRHSGYADPTTVPSGWTLLDSIEESTGHALVYYKTLASGDLTTHTWSWALSRASVARATLYGGHDTTSPIEAVANQYAASGDWVYAGSLTSDKKFHVAIFTFYSGSTQSDALPSGYALGRGIVGSTASALWVDVNDRDDWAGGEHNPAIFKSSVTNHMGFHFAINPASTNRVTRGATIRGTNSSSSTSAAVSFAGAGLFTVGALAVVFISRAAAVNPSSVPSGWTLLNSYLSTYGSWVYYKIMTADDNVTHTWSWAASAKTLQHAVFVVGFDPDDPIPTGWNRAVATSASSTMEIGSVTTSRPFLLYLTSKYNTSSRYTSTPSGYVEALDFGSTSPDFWQTIGSDPAWGGGTRNPALSIYSDSGETTSATATYRYGWQIPIAVAPASGSFATERTVHEDATGGFATERQISVSSIDASGSFATARTVHEDVAGSFATSRIVNEDATGGFASTRSVTEDAAGSLSAERMVVENVGGVFATERVAHEDASGSFASERSVAEAATGSFATERTVHEDATGGFGAIRTVHEDAGGSYATSRDTHESASGSHATSRVVHENASGSFATERIVEQTSFEAATGGFSARRLVIEDASGTLHTLRTVYENADGSFLTSRAVHEVSSGGFATLRILLSARETTGIDLAFPVDTDIDLALPVDTDIDLMVGAITEVDLAFPDHLPALTLIDLSFPGRPVYCVSGRTIGRDVSRSARQANTTARLTRMLGRRITLHRRVE